MSIRTTWKTYENTGGGAHPLELLIHCFWAGARELAILTSSQVMLQLPVWGPHAEKPCSIASFLPTQLLTDSLSTSASVSSLSLYWSISYVPANLSVCCSEVTDFSFGYLESGAGSRRKPQVPLPSTLHPRLELSLSSSL